MDEALRRAYLAAMDIPVWIPRSEPDPFTPVGKRPTPLMQPAPASRGAPSAPDAAQDKSTQPRAGRGQSMLGEKSAPAQRRAPIPTAAATANVRSFTFGFVLHGNTLLIDAQPLSPRGVELSRAICFAVEGNKAAFTSQDFSWPPTGAAFVASEARDALLARIDKLSGGALACLLLSGESPAFVLLGWSASQWTTRAMGVHRMEGLDCDIVLLPDVSAMLGSAAEKRVAWEHIRAARSPHA